MRAGSGARAWEKYEGLGSNYCGELGFLADSSVSIERRARASDAEWDRMRIRGVDYGQGV